MTDRADKIARNKAEMETLLRAYPHLISHVVACFEQAMADERERCATIAESLPEIAARIREGGEPKE